MREIQPPRAIQREQVIVFVLREQQWTEVRMARDLPDPVVHQNTLRFYPPRIDRPTLQPGQCDINRYLGLPKSGFMEYSGIGKSFDRTKRFDLEWKSRKL